MNYLSTTMASKFSSTCLWRKATNVFMANSLMMDKMSITILLYMITIVKNRIVGMCSTCMAVISSPTISSFIMDYFIPVVIIMEFLVKIVICIIVLVTIIVIPI